MEKKKMKKVKLNFNKVEENLKSAIERLYNESEIFYDKGDDFRGHIRTTAAEKLKVYLDDLTSEFETINKMLEY